MKTPAKKRTAAELAAAVLWCALTMGTDRLFFRYDWRTPAFFVYKALFLVLAFGLVHGAVTLVQKLRAGDKFARRWVAWTLPYCSTLLAISTPMMENVAISMMTPWMQATLAMDLMPPETV